VAVFLIYPINRQIQNLGLPYFDGNICGVLVTNKNQYYRVFVWYVECKTVINRVAAVLHFIICDTAATAVFIFIYSSRI